MSKIGIVAYGQTGNIYNIQKALEFIGSNVKIITKEADFEEVDKLILPGVGNFSMVMKEMKNNNLYTRTKTEITSKPSLGICLGMQILASVGFETKETEGLAVIEAEVKAIHCHAQVPHMGFNTIDVQKKSKLLAGIEEEEFYFMHSYEMVNYSDILSLTRYAGHSFVSAVEKGMLFGVQFHPEKSRDAGLELFRNFDKI